MPTPAAGLEVAGHCARTAQAGTGATAATPIPTATAAIGDNWNGRRDGGNAWNGRNRGNGNDRWDSRRDNRGSGYNNGYRSWSRSWRDDNRYNWYGYRRSHPDRYRWGDYRSPYRNHFYSRVGVGFYLDSMFYGSNYWIDDPWSYRLPEVYGPYRWIRYYDDALLVDIYSGEVVDVIENFFW